MKTEKSKDFQTLLDAVAIINAEATFQITPEGITARCMDPSRVALVDFNLSKAFFDEYECKEAVTLTTNLTELQKFLRRAGKATTEITFAEAEDARLKLQFTHALITRNFNFPTLEPQKDETPLPKVTFKTKTKLAADLFYSSLEDAQLVSSYVRINIDKDRIFMEAPGEVSSAEITIKKDAEGLFELQIIEPSKATFSLSYLTDIVRAIKRVGDLIVVESATDMPIKIGVVTSAVPVKLTYYLAPRIEVE